MAGPTILKPIYLVDALGEYARLPDGAIINIGGTSGPTFTVGGKPLLFADGTTTDGSEGVLPALTLQKAYDNSGVEALINFISGKDFVLHAVNGNEFRFDADTGLVSIDGDLTVNGNLNANINTSVDADKVWIRPSAGNYVPFLIEPRAGVTPLTNLADIKVTHGGPSVFYITPDGKTHITDLVVESGIINGIDLAALQSLLTDHIDLTSPEIKHTATQISVDDTDLEPLEGDNVQEVLQSVASIISNVSAGNVRGYEHVQLIPAETWVINHAGQSRRVQITVWDNTDEAVYPDSISIVDTNTVIITYHTAVTGRAVLMLF